MINIIPMCMCIKMQSFNENIVKHCQAQHSISYPRLYNVKLCLLKNYFCPIILHFQTNIVLLQLYFPLNLGNDFILESKQLYFMAKTLALISVQLQFNSCNYYQLKEVAQKLKSSTHVLWILILQQSFHHCCQSKLNT